MTQRTAGGNVSAEASGYLWAADEFLVALAQVSGSMLASIFLMAHVLELHLKAYLVATGAKAPVTHDLSKLLEQCRGDRHTFPIVFHFRPAVLEALKTSAGDRMHERLSSDDFRHFCQYSGLYYGAYAQGDLKYLGTVVKRPLQCISSIYPYQAAALMLELLDPIRLAVGYGPSAGEAIREQLQRVPHIPDPAANLLAEYELRREDERRRTRESPRETRG